MAKYIIDIPDEEETMWEGFNGDLFIPITMNKGTKTWVNTDLKMTPYTEPDRKAIEDEVWSLAREIAYCMGLQECIYAGMLHDDIYNSASGVLEKLTYQEAKAKYDAWKVKNDEIRVGDEVYDHTISGTGIVTNVVNKNMVDIMWDDGSVNDSVSVEDLRKTGRHFSQVEELMKKMRWEG